MINKEIAIIIYFFKITDKEKEYITLWQSVVTCFLNLEPFGEALSNIFHGD
jgi:hypothetical protein